MTTQASSLLNSFRYNEVRFVQRQLWHREQTLWPLQSVFCKAGLTRRPFPLERRTLSVDQPFKRIVKRVKGLWSQVWNRVG